MYFKISFPYIECIMPVISKKVRMNQCVIMNDHKTNNMENNEYHFSITLLVI